MLNRNHEPRIDLSLLESKIAGLAGQPGPHGPAGVNCTKGLDFNSTGNMSLFNGTDSYDPRTALIAQGIGSLPFDFRSITYFTVKNGELTPYPNGTNLYDTSCE